MFYDLEWVLKQLTKLIIIITFLSDVFNFVSKYNVTYQFEFLFTESFKNKVNYRF